MDQNRPYLTKFLIENGSFLLTKAHVFGANWTERPLTSEVFLGHLSLWKDLWNVSKIKGLALTFLKMVRKSRIGPKMTELRSFENYQFSKIRVAVEWWWPEYGFVYWPRVLPPPPQLGFVKVSNFESSVTRSFLVRFDFFTPFSETPERARAHSRWLFTMTDDSKASEDSSRIIQFGPKTQNLGH